MMETMTGMDSDERLWEARLVADVRAGVRLAENELYAYCADYFWRKYRGVFFVGEEEAAEIFHRLVGAHRAGAPGMSRWKHGG